MIWIAESPSVRPSIHPYKLLLGVDSSKIDITRINTAMFLKDMFRHAYAKLVNE